MEYTDVFLLHLIDVVRMDALERKDFLSTHDRNNLISKAIETFENDEKFAKFYENLPNNKQS